MVWTTPEHVKLLWPDNAPEQPPTDAKLEQSIASIEAQIRARFPDIQLRVDNGTLDEELIRFYTSTWIIEYGQRNFNPYTQEAMGYTGAGNRSVTFESKWRKNLILSDADLDVFMPKNAGTIMSVDMAPQAGAHTDLEYLGWHTTRILM